MITIVHGDDIVSSRKYFLEERQKTDEGRVFDGKTVTLTDIVQAFEGAMFAQKRIFIEQFFSERKGKEFEEIVAYLAKNGSSHDIFFWEGRQLPAKMVSSIPKSKVFPFLFPRKIFPFLDQIAPGNGRKLVSLFHDLARNVEKELVFYMLVRQFRMLFALSENPPVGGQIDEVKKLAPWQRQKLTRQAQAFSHNLLQLLYKKLYAIDFAQKTGATTFSLSQQIDIFLLEV